MTLTLPEGNIVYTEAFIAVLSYFFFCVAHNVLRVYKSSALRVLIVGF